MYLPSGEKATAYTRDEPSVNWRSSLLVAVSHKRAVLSQLPVSTCLPSGEKATTRTTDEWPMNWRISLPVALSHRRAVLSQLPVSTCLPSGEKAAASTLAEWPVNWRISLPVALSHKSAVLSELPVSTCLPSGEKHTLVTGEECPNCATSWGRVGCSPGRLVWTSSAAASAKPRSVPAVTMQKKKRIICSPFNLNYLQRQSRPVSIRQSHLISAPAASPPRPPPARPTHRAWPLRPR